MAKQLTHLILDHMENSRRVLMLILREAILDALADDGESIVQVREYLKYLNILSTAEDVIELLDCLLKEKKIRIAYPQNIKVESLHCGMVNDFWFELTDMGRCEWEKIEN
jgi:hypothetical protein